LRVELARELMRGELVRGDVCGGRDWAGEGRVQASTEGSGMDLNLSRLATASLGMREA